MKLFTTFIALLWVLFFCINTAQAENKISLSIPKSIEFSYDSFSELTSTNNFKIGITPEKSEEDIPPQSHFSLVIRPVNNTEFILSGTNSSLPLQLRPLKNNSYNFQKNIYTQKININKNSESTFEFQLSIPASIYADTGSYSMMFEVLVLDDKTQIPVSQKLTTTINVNVIPKLQTNIAGTSGRFENGKNFATLDFNILETGESKTAYIQVRGNALAKITISSENQGKMVEKKSKGYVEYSVNIDGINSKLQTPLELSRRPKKNLNGSSYPMKVTLGNVSGKFSGIYTDIINVDVTLQ